VTIKNNELLESSQNTPIESTDKNAIPAQSIQVVKIETEISGPVEETEETVTDSARKHEEYISVSRE